MVDKCLQIIYRLINQQSNKTIERLELWKRTDQVPITYITNDILVKIFSSYKVAGFKSFSIYACNILSILQSVLLTSL